MSTNFFEELTSKKNTLSEHLFTILKTIWTNEIEVEDYSITIEKDKCTIVIDHKEGDTK